MKVYKVSIVDERTRMQIIAADLSYNFACGFLAKNGVDFRKVEIKTDYRRNRTLIVTKNRLFIYDEDRGLLLGE